MEQSVYIENIKKTMSALAIKDSIELNTHHLRIDTLGRFEKYMREHFTRFKKRVYVFMGNQKWK